MNRKRKNPMYLKKSDQLAKRVKKLESSVCAEETKKYYLPQNETQLVSTTISLTMLNIINPLTQSTTASSVNGVSYALTGIGMKFLLHNTSSDVRRLNLAEIMGIHYHHHHQRENVMLPWN